MITDIHTHYNIDHALRNVRFASDSMSLPGIGLCSVGIHPWDVNDESETLMPQLESLARDQRVVAIGETGLDRVCGSDFTLQQAVFLRHIQLSEKLCKPLVIHMVRTAQEVIATHRHLSPHMAWMVHGFRGNANVARMLVNEGILLSVGERFNTEAVKSVPIDMLLLETDESTMPIEDITSRVADARGIATDEMLQWASANARRFLSTDC